MCKGWKYSSRVKAVVNLSPSLIPYTSYGHVHYQKWPLSLEPWVSQGVAKLPVCPASQLLILNEVLSFRTSWGSAALVTQIFQQLDLSSTLDLSPREEFLRNSDFISNKITNAETESPICRTLWSRRQLFKGILRSWKEIVMAGLRDNFCLSVGQFLKIILIS